MSGTFIRIVGEDGQPMHMPWDVEEQGPLPDGVVVTSERPSAFHEWQDGKWVEREGSAKLLADGAAGVEHILEVHLQKRIEAVFIASGYPLSRGLIADDAARLKISPAAIADVVLEKSAAFFTAELSRQAPVLADEAGALPTGDGQP